MTSRPLGFTTRTWVLAGVLLLAVATWFALRKQINRSLTITLLLRSESPHEWVFDPDLRVAESSHRESPHCRVQSVEYSRVRWALGPGWGSASR
jgi:hypothetical protein